MLTRTLALLFCLLTALAFAAEPKVSLIVGRWLPGEHENANDKPSPLKAPFGIDFDANGTMWIVELGGGRVHRRMADGQLAVVAGDGSKSYKGDGGPMGQATFNGMHNVAVTPAGDVYIADTWNHSVRRIAPASGVISTVFGTGQSGFAGDGGPAARAQFFDVMCITLATDNSALYVDDLRNRRIRRVDFKTGIVRTLAGNGKAGVPTDGALATESPLSDPRAVAPDALGNVYVLERGGHALRVVRPDGRIYTVAGTGKAGAEDGPALQARLNSPKHLCADAANNILIADEGNGLIRKYDPRAKTLTTVLGRGRIKLSQPHGVCWEQNRLYVVDTGHDRILRIEE